MFDGPSSHKLNRKSSQDSSSKKESKSNNSATPPPPPPNTAKPLPIPGASVVANALNSQTRSSSPASSARPTTPDRRTSGDLPAPPIVVVSSDPAQERLSGYSDRFQATEPPRATTLNRLRAGPKDTIPIVGKPPRKQRSSRFVVTEKVEIERLPAFNGSLFRIYGASSSDNISPETPAGERPQLFLRKLHQCRVLFDFNDTSSELRGKQIKAQTLHEMLDYITTQRGVITENVYPEVVNMVRALSPPLRFLTYV